MKKEEGNTKQSKLTLSEKIAKLADFFTFGIWSSDIHQMKGARAYAYGFLRVITTLVTGILKNKIPIQAASLSYTTLLALGPIIAVVIIFSGMVFREKGDEFLYNKIVEAMVFIMPAVNEVVDPPQSGRFHARPDMQKPNTDSGKTVAAAGSSNADSEKTEAVSKSSDAGSENSEKINPKIKLLIKNISKGTTSLGIFGTITVVVTCLLLCINMESAFNTVWDLHKGRRWVLRLAFYWMLITLGVVMGLFGMTFLTGAQLGSVFKNIPIISQYASWGVQLVGIFAIIFALALFYKFMPNTRVKIVPAFVGAFIVAMLLIANNKMSFLYIGKIVQNQNFYGFLAIVPIVMFSLYIFWLFILTGAQITYAVQNIDFLSSSKLWKGTGFRVKEMIALAVYAKVAKPFCEGKEAPTLEKISLELKTPKEITKACLDNLEDKDLICSIEKSEIESVVYKPSSDPENLTLAQFSKILSQCESDEILLSDLAKESPAVRFASKMLAEFEASADSQKSIKEIF